MPYWWSTIPTSLSVPEASERVHALIRPRPDFGESVRMAFKGVTPTDPPFYGNYDGKSFRLQRVVNHRNPAIPSVRVEIEPAPGGATLYVLTRVSAFNLAFTAVWFGFLIWSLFTSFQPLLLAMIAFGVVITVLPFYFEAKWALVILRDAVGAQSKS
ncbi:MAG TPA: hypothetical protein VEU30_10780 [Thermoanaerobaculia bacterium]|nr:hypothetical protein [Thermoanaerobaculia bacterium]